MATSRARALFAFCPDWPVLATGRPPSEEVAVVQANRVVAASPAARVAGVVVGMRRREAQSACPGLAVVARAPALEARAWEPAVAAVEEVAPGPEVLAPGQLALGTRGPSRYFGGDAALAARVAGLVEAALPEAWRGCCRVGVADGLFTAGLAARSARPGGPLVVPGGGSAGFLAPMPVGALCTEDLQAVVGARPAELAELVSLLGRLGVRTMGDFAALPAPVVLARFGATGARAHRLAAGLASRPVTGREPPPDWSVDAELSPPAENVQSVVFVARVLAEQLHDRLAGSGLVCTRLAVVAGTEQGGTLRRSWRHDGALSASAIAERARWQLEGWALANQLSGVEGEGTGGPGAGRVTRLALVPEEVRPDGHQLGLWGADAGARDRAARAMARVQAVLGPAGVVTGVLQGGRDYLDQVRLVPWGEPREPLRPGGPVTASSEPATGAPRPARATGRAKDGPPPWPGRLPGLAPCVVHPVPVPVQLLGSQGEPVTVSSRGLLGPVPAYLVVGHRGRRQAVTAWAGPWPLEERWWAHQARRRARVQVVAEDGRAYLLAREHQEWWAEASYD